MRNPVVLLLLLLVVVLSCVQGCKPQELEAAAARFKFGRSRAYLCMYMCTPGCAFGGGVFVDIPVVVVVVVVVAVGTGHGSGHCSVNVRFNLRCKCQERSPWNRCDVYGKSGFTAPSTATRLAKDTP